MEFVKQKQTIEISICQCFLSTHPGNCSERRPQMSFWKVPVSCRPEHPQRDWPEITALRGV